MQPPDAPPRRSRPMPWQGHNAEVLRQREQPPRLPPGWGASFRAPPITLGPRVAPVLLEDALPAQVKAKLR